MIYTVTCNPAVDYVISVEDFRHGDINRTMQEEIYYGGKGINVSIVLTRLGIKNTALGFIAGFTGEAIEKGLKEQGIRTEFIKVSEGFSRINVKIQTAEETAVNGRGPVIKEEDLEKLFLKIQTLKKGDMLVLAGSVPPALSQNVYEKMLEGLAEREVLFVVDAEKELLVNALKYKPFLIKPNTMELSDLFGKSIVEEEEIEYYAAKLTRMGARNVLVSRGAKGALLLSEDGALRKQSAVKGTPVNTVGAGDSMVAGFLAGFLRNGSYEDALRYGIAAGTATAFSSGIATKEGIISYLG